MSSDFDFKADAKTKTDGRSGTHLYMIAVYGGEYLATCTPEVANAMEGRQKHRIGVTASRAGQPRGWPRNWHTNSG
ncbi:MAG: hypothetical protein WAM14_00045 [Candidatus Nitrosopolaris sp.]